MLFWHGGVDIIIRFCIFKYSAKRKLSVQYCKNVMLDQGITLQVDAEVRRTWSEACVRYKA